MRPALQITAIRQRLLDAGAKPEHEQRVLRHWLHALPLEAGRRRIEHFLPRSLREALPALMAELQALVQLHSVHADAEDAERWLLRLADGASVEAVALPRDGLCVSTQVGCAVGCRFCMTGRGGLQRQLGSAEIAAQVALARTRRRVHKVVFMGMGEPAHNLDAVLEAIELLGSVGGIAHKKLVLSTVGDERLFERLPQGRVKPALALSLHSLHAERRAWLLPRAPRWDPAALVLRAEAYARASGYPLQLQWTLLAGINDGDDELEALAQLLAGRYAVLNLIPYNRVDGLPYARPALEQAAAMARRLHRRGVLTKLRRSAAQDVDGGCGQLRARVVPIVAAAPAAAQAHTGARSIE